MFASKKLGLTLVISTLLAACASTPKNPNAAAETTVTTESSELDLEKMAKERAAQGLAARKTEAQESSKNISDNSQEPQLAAVSDELKALAAPVANDYQRAVVLMKANQLDEAFSLFEAVHQKAPQLAGPLLNQALIHVQRQQYKEAAALLEKAVAANSKNPYAFNLQGFVYRQLGQFKNARTAYEMALQLSPNYAKAHFNLGVLAELYLQDLPLALTHFEAYQKTQKDEDATVGKWIIDLQKRTGVYQAPAKKPAASQEIIETPTPVDATNADNSTENTKTSPESQADTATSTQDTVKSEATDTTSAVGAQP
ncbi:MAG: tetratricopeptide repeat protein [Moraxellaceae bacterium]|nr:tetratricopeptide repeat protein [Moraxellaceae bacterium]